MTSLTIPQISDLSPVEQTLTSLIQQYLSLLLPSNATFLAERLVAYNPSPHSHYMLAMCHYRSGSPKRAHSTLLNVPVDNEMGDCILHLSAQCCVDLGLWSEAEDYLLRNARIEYAQFKKDVKDDEELKQKTMDEWFCQLVDDVEMKYKRDDGDEQNEKEEENDNGTFPLMHAMASSIPIPNGAVGLKLLGDVCRRTLRNQKASLYYKLSLKLDPMMWCSYEALCEIGYASLPENDPSIIFGVIPQGLLHIPASMGGYSGHDVSQTRGRAHVPEDHVPMSNVRTTSNSAAVAAASATIHESPFSINHSPIITEDDTTIQHLDHVSMMGAAGRLSFGATPLQTPHGYNDTHSIQRNQNNPESSQRQTSIIRGTTLFQAPPTRRKSELVSTALFSTPATPQQTSRVIDRAKKIAGRRYYEPSPETTPPNAMRIVALPPTSIKTAKKKYRRSFVGMGYDESSSNISAYHEKRDEHKGRLLFESMEQYGDVVVESTRMDTTLDLSAVKSTKKSFVPKLSPPRRQQKESALTAEETKIDRTSSLRTFDTDSDEGVKFVLDLLATLGAAQRMICSFKCKEALQIFHTLPHSQFQTGWVQHQVGRAYLALPDYTNAQRALETMQQLEPHRMKGLELLSTTLYLLKKEVELSNLSQRAVNFDQMSPETWCVVGNFFSLQKEHKSALTFFHRAIQLDPNFTYAHTLSGHEFVANEDFDQAIAAYRDAIRVDDRHYNAWNGLGEIYFKQEKYDIAEYHFQKGLSINPQSSVIRCHLSQTQQAKGNLHLALDTLAMVDERNPQAKYQRANILLALDRCEEALLEMEKVRDASPRESSVYITMGRIYKRLGKTDEAMKAFLCALDLDPKENNSIKAAIDRIDEPELDEDLSAF